MHAPSADAAIAEKAWKRRRRSAYRDAMTRSLQSCLSPPLLVVLAGADGGRPENRQKRSAGKISREKNQGAARSESGQVEGRKNKTL